MTEAYLDVPGATLFYKVRGGGPVLLILQGGAGSADGSDGLVDALADRYTVIAYDRRGLSKSSIHDGTHPPTVRTHSEDASHLLAHLTDEPAFVFASSIGAVIGLDLITSHPGQVRLLVAHEAGISAFLPEPARSELLARQLDVDDTFAREGLMSAMGKFFTLSGALADDPDAEVERSAPAGDRVAQHGRNIQFFLTHDAPDAHRYVPDLPAD